MGMHIHENNQQCNVAIVSTLVESVLYSDESDDGECSRVDECYEEQPRGWAGQFQQFPGFKGQTVATILTVPELMQLVPIEC